MRRTLGFYFTEGASRIQREKIVCPSSESWIPTSLSLTWYTTECWRILSKGQIRRGDWAAEIKGMAVLRLQIFLDKGSANESQEQGQDGSEDNDTNFIGIRPPFWTRIVLDQ